MARLPRPERQSREELVRALGLDGLTREDCIRDLFGDLIEWARQGEDKGPSWPWANGGRVVQTGPGQRNKPEESE